MASNYSIYGIAVFWFLSVPPHLYALFILAKANDCEDKTAKWATFEKLELVSKNGFENLPLSGAAVILGNMATIASGTMNASTVAFVGFRIAYWAAYVKSMIHKTFFGTGFWFLSVIPPLYLIAASGGRLQKEQLIRI
ncbi:hypothetical protein K469DRAFT_754577 [Zopfia rhizophila CBS 207.26]|uniref:Uncharacterized protein n=1 Tax=Zopfia rhizophila CBS 207.26 TaxID=1314779 RepID=A0A6A6DJ45_9PEZI|nr:hypothetical protein K469DRAFT_754577 [Zopfia rhizophila CBS 207.26]